MLSIMLAVGFCTFAISFTIIYNKYDLNTAKLTSLNNGIAIVSANGEENDLRNTNRCIIEIETLPTYIKNAFIDTEDKRFYKHNGYDLMRIAKAAMVNFVNQSKSEGASTISQQLVKNALLSNKKTYQRKIEEIILSIKLEKAFKKDEILEMYLNTIYFGGNAYGIQNASYYYFNKPANELSLNEACCLAGIIKSPNYYSPKTHYDNAIERRNLVAKLMYKQKHITKQQLSSVINSDITLCNETRTDNSYEKMAIMEACKLLNMSERELINRQFKIVTFKDNKLQNAVIKANNQTLSDTKNTTNSPLDSVSAVVDNHGQMLAYYENSNYDLSNLKRQPASTLKPLVVYLPCIIHNICSPASLILDEEINFNGFCPQNASKTFSGYISARDALSKSLNIPAVKLLDSVGISKANEVLTNMGINLTKKDMNLSLALGGTNSGIKLMDLLSAYSILANGGEENSLNFVSKILDKDGNVVYSHSPFKQQKFNSEDCFLVTDMLKDSAKTGTATRLNSLNIPVASKTGTAFNGKNNTDLFNISYTSEHTLLCWVGNIKDNKLPDSLLSSVQPTTINKEILSYLYSNHKPADFALPKGVEKMAYDVVEAEENHIIVKPTTNLSRYIKYDYFKTSNLPSTSTNTGELKMDVNLTKFGAEISFATKRNKNYTLSRFINDKSEVIKEFTETSSTVNYLDDNIFNYDKICYKLTDGQNESEVTIYPKEFLINSLNNQLSATKKKWYV